MELLILFAFLAGLVTIISPCVLPVLPILLSTSTESGRTRPVGIVLGLASTFVVVTLAVTAAAQALALPATWLRLFAIVALGFFGLTLLVPALGRAMERVLSPLTRLVGARQGSGGFGGGLIVGAGLGLLWAPCVGPIMASVIGLTAWAGITPAAVAITLAYAVGAGLPMLLVAYGGRRLANRTRKLGARTGIVQQVFGALTVVACVALFFGAETNLQTFALRNLPPEWSAALTLFERGDAVQTRLDELQKQTASSQSAAQPAQVAAVAPVAAQPTATPKPRIDLQDMGAAPELVGITQWWNSQPLTLQQLRGKVVIVEFWTYACYNCANTRPYVQALYNKYHSQGLEIIGVHTPELSFEYVPENIKQAISDQNITWPVAFDPNYKTWGAYNNRYWPAFYFIDANGHIRYTHFGEGNYDYNEKVVQQLLDDAKGAAQNQPVSVASLTSPNSASVAVAQATPTPKPQPTATPKPKPTAIPTMIPTSIPTPQPGLQLSDLGAAPELAGLTNWINSKPLTLAGLKGKVVIIDFWTFACYNCANTRPYVQALYNKYHSQGLEIIGVHAPEFSYERVPENVVKATKDQGINWPVALDQDFTTWRAYNNRYWPAFYFIDANGHIRYTHFGEGNYDYNEKVVQQLLSEAKAGSK